jgi:hypothetical protein
MVKEYIEILIEISLQNRNDWPLKISKIPDGNDSVLKTVRT